MRTTPSARAEKRSEGTGPRRLAVKSAAGIVGDTSTGPIWSKCATKQISQFDAKWSWSWSSSCADAAIACAMTRTAKSAHTNWCGANKNRRRFALPLDIGPETRAQYSLGQGNSSRECVYSARRRFTPRAAWRMRCSFSTKPMRTNPSPPSPNPNPGATAISASRIRCLANSTDPISA